MKKWVICLTMVLLMAVPAYGAEENFPVPGLDELWEQAERYGVTEGDTLQSGLSALLDRGLEELERLAKRGGLTVVKLMAVVLVCGLAENLREGENNTRAVEMAGALAITALTMTDMAAMIGLGWETLGEMETFSRALLPVMAVLTAASGGPTAAALRQGATVLFSQLLLTAMDHVLIPLVYAFVAVHCVKAAAGLNGLGKLADLMKGTAGMLLTGFLLAFVGYLTASGAIAGGVDASAVKAARMAITRVIPVVGGILADASESVLAGAAALRGAVGAAGMLVVLAICLIPFLRLALQYLAYKLAAALCAMVAQPALSQLIDAIGSAFGMVLGMTGAGALILLVSVVAALKAVIP